MIHGRPAGTAGLAWPILLLASAVVLAESAPAATGPERIIRSIRVECEGVFDTPDNFLESAANTLHWDTHESTVRRELLFQEGDRYDRDLLDETERRLRSLSYLRDVMIVADSVSADSVDVVVRTRDVWTLGGRIGFKQEGGSPSMGVSVSEANMFGRGQALNVSYVYGQEFGPSHGMSAGFTDPRLFGSRWAGSIGYATAHEHTRTTLILNRPFYSDAATWSAGAMIDVSRQHQRYFEDGLVIREARFKQDREHGWFSLSNGADTRLYGGLGVIRTQTVADESFLHSNDNVAMVTVSAGIMQRDYYRSAFLNHMGMIEDVPLGYHLNVTGGIGKRTIGEKSDVVYLSGLWQHAIGFNERFYLTYRGVATTSFIDGAPTDTRFDATVLQHVRLLPQHTFLVRADGMIGSNWSRSVQRSLATLTGMRGYGRNDFAGQRLAMVNLEYRFSPDVTLWIFRFGGALFHDAGAAWAEDEPWGAQHFSHTSGIGLRIESTIRGGRDLVRIDFPFTHDGHRFTQVSISGSQLLSAFLDLDVRTPVDLF